MADKNLATTVPQWGPSDITWEDYLSDDDRNREPTGRGGSETAIWWRPYPYEEDVRLPHEKGSEDASGVSSPSSPRGWPTPPRCRPICDLLGAYYSYAYHKEQWGIYLHLKKMRDCADTYCGFKGISAPADRLGVRISLYLQVVAHEYFHYLNECFWKLLGDSMNVSSLYNYYFSTNHGEGCLEEGLANILPHFAGLGGQMGNTKLILRLDQVGVPDLPKIVLPITNWDNYGRRFYRLWKQQKPAAARITHLLSGYSDLGVWLDERSAGHYKLPWNILKGQGSYAQAANLWYGQKPKVPQPSHLLFSAMKDLLRYFTCTEDFVSQGTILSGSIPAIRNIGGAESHLLKVQTHFGALLQQTSIPPDPAPGLWPALSFLLRGTEKVFPPGNPGNVPLYLKTK